VTRRRRSAALVATLAVAALAAGVTLVRLGVPPDIVFDETYYVADARAMLATGVEESFAVHPPLGKWVIALGMAAVGDTPIGWRIGGALLSVLAVAATVELGRRLTGRIRFGVIAGALVAMDGVWLTVARLAMLDATLAALVTFGTLALVVDHRRATSRASDVPVAAGPDGERDTLEAPSVSRWPLLVAGVLFGLATATKWSGLLALGGAGLLAAGWELAARRRRSGLPPAEVARAAAPVVVGLVLVPVAVYALAWLPWLAGYPASSTAAPECEGAVAASAACDPSSGERLRGLVRHHAAVFAFHSDLDADHPYRAPATTWPTQYRPVVAFYENCGADGTDREGRACLMAPGEASEVVILGNPALWWSSLVLVPLAAAALRRRDGAAAVPLVMLGAQYLPWLVVARPVFNFYTAPLVPALALAVVVACRELDRPARRGATVVGFVAAAAVAGGGALIADLARPTAATTAMLAATAGTAIGSVLDARRERTGDTSDPGRPIGTAIAWLVLAAAALLLVYFSPLWLGVPVDDAALRRRWWLRSWV
jgi:dolichyl-phosphate-mannose-protein mannosyltransferase